MSDKHSRTILKNLEISDYETVVDWGKTCVFAPHPDDESLGCGGAIALLRQSGLPVSVVVMSDGTLSHPNSLKFPPDKLCKLRENEIADALRILGVTADEITFLRYRDRSVPGAEAANFKPAVERIKNLLSETNPATVILPWRRDPHPDHRATWQIVRSAVGAMNARIKMLEYPIWLWEMAEEIDLPLENEIKARRLNIEKVIEKKQSAIKAHVSQTTDLIDDDPQAFRLSPEVLMNFAVPFEIFLEEI